MSVSSNDLLNTPNIATDAVFVESVEMPKDHPTVFGYDFNNGINYEDIMKAFVSTGFQASNLGKAINIINEALAWRLSDEPVKEDDTITDPEERAQIKSTIFLGITSNMISSGLREVIRYLVEHKLVDCIVTTCGAIEEDLMKVYKPHYHGDFALSGKDLRLKGLNRLGNLIVPNENYVKFEEFVMPILNQMLEEQKNDGKFWSPSMMIDRFGQEIDSEESVLFWAHKNSIPVFCPAITDGSVGDMIYFQSYNNPGFIVDIASDIRKINDMAIHAHNTTMLILGGGLIKHHICNANLMRNGANYAVYINTAQEFDGSDSGARPDEAVSWGKIKLDAKHVKVYAEATLVFPLLVAESFAKVVEARKQEQEQEQEQEEIKQEKKEEKKQDEKKEEGAEESEQN